MVKEQSISKEARLGSEGAEVWYKIATGFYDVWLNKHKNTQQKDTYLATQMYKDLVAEASELTGNEKTDYLQGMMPIVFKEAMAAYAAYLGSYVRGSQFTTLSKLDYIFDYYANGAFLEDSKVFQKILTECPEASLREVHRFLLGDESAVEQVMQDEEKNRKAKLANKAEGAT